MSDDNRQVTELFAFAVISGVVLMRNWVAKKVRRHTTTITARRVVKKTHFMEKSNLTPSLFLNNRDVVTITKVCSAYIIIIVRSAASKPSFVQCIIITDLIDDFSSRYYLLLFFI